MVYTTLWGVLQILKFIFNHIVSGIFTVQAVWKKALYEWEEV